ncbi:MAG: hypothetical protein ACYDDZ_08145 [Acidimicrobiales bacterium]
MSPRVPSSRTLDRRLPVLVGVGAASADAGAAQLMSTAAEAAILDSGGRSVAARIDTIAVPQGSWSYPDPARSVAADVGAPVATTHLFELGIPQQTPINRALSAIASGASEVALVVGGEARRWERDQAASGRSGAEPGDPGAGPDVLHRRPGPLLEEVEVAHRLWEPVEQYAMIENALRAAEGRTLSQHQREIAELWSRCNQVARSNPRAAFPEAREAGWIARPSQENRPLAFPYAKWHSSQWTVNQAAALVLCSVDAARRMGVTEDRWIFPLVGIESSHAVSLLRRRDPHRWPAMAVLGEAASRRIGRSIAEVDALEVYSCFPAAVRVQQRELGLDRSGTPTVTGGMSFAGGPFNNYVLQSLVDVITTIRGTPAGSGAVTSVSGLLTKPGIGIWATAPDGRAPLVADFHATARAVTPTVEVVPTLDGFAGAGTVVTYTVTYDGADPVRVVALCSVPDGRRCVAVSDDRGLAAAGVVTDLIGTPVRIGDGTLVTADR